MILIYTDSRSEFSEIFKSSDYSVPFVDKTILELSLDIWISAAKKMEEELVVYFPESWNLEGNSYDNFIDIIKTSPNTLIIIVAANEVLSDGIEHDKVILAKTNPGVLYENILWSNGNMPTIKTEGGMELQVIDIENYIDISSDYMNGTEGYNPNAVLSYGNPVILGRVDDNSTICGPCYISEDSVITNSTIFPGSVILGSKVTDSEVFASVLHDTTIVDSRVKDSVLSGSVVLNTNLKSSTVPNGARLSGRKV
jgi:hypothetical protein